MKVAQRPFISLFHIIIFSGCFLLAQVLAADNPTDSRIRNEVIRPSEIVCVAIPDASATTDTSDDLMVRLAEHVFLSRDEAYTSYEQKAEEIKKAIFTNDISKTDAEKKLDDYAVSYFFFTSADCGKDKGKECKDKMDKMKDTVYDLASAIYDQNGSELKDFYKRVSGGGSRNSQMRESLKRYYGHIDKIIMRYNRKAEGKNDISPKELAEIVRDINREIKDMAKQCLPDKLPQSVVQIAFFVNQVIAENFKLTNLKPMIDTSCGESGT
jgi:Mg2+ and Co2+ transporter CorA